MASPTQRLTRPLTQPLMAALTASRDLGGLKAGVDPLAPPAPVLAWVSGPSDATPDFEVTAGSGDVLQISDVVKFYVDGALAASFTLTGGDLADGDGDLGLSSLAAGSYQIWVTVTRSGHTSAKSNTVTVTIDLSPVITSSSSISVAENSPLSHTLTANEAVTWTKTGGADAALFTLVGSTLSMTAKDYEAPADADTNNTYIVQVTATDAGLNTTNQTITVTVTDVSETVYVLDGVSNVKAAYALRRLSSSYSGSAIRVRRSSDNAEQDIGFSGEHLDTASFSSFIGGGSGFVRKIYDQSGAGNDLGQATAAAQPQLTLAAQNSHPVMTFDGTNDALFGPWSSQLSTALTAEILGKMTANFKAVFDVSDTGSLNVAYSLRNSSVNFIARDQSGNQGLKASDTNFHQFACFFVPGSLTRILVDGSVGTDGAGAALLTADQCCLGALLDSSTPNTFFLSGTIGEAIFLNANLTGGADATLRANQKSYWGTP